MPDQTTCPDCGVEYRQSTSDANEGRCKRCKPDRKGAKEIERAADKMEFGLRLVLAFVFASILAGFGYGLGAVIWSGIGIMLAIAFFPLGLVYGFFCAEINPFLRGIFRALLHID